MYQNDDRAAKLMQWQQFGVVHKCIYQNMIKGELKTDYGSELYKYAYTKRLMGI